MPGGDPGEFPGIAPSPPPALPRSLCSPFPSPLTPQTPNLRVPPTLLSLRYPHVAVPESGPGLPQFVSMGSLDGIPSRRRRSERDRAEPQAPGMAAGAEPGSWDPRSRHSEQHRHGATREPEMLQDRHSQSGAERGEPGLGRGLWGWDGNCGTGMGIPEIKAEESANYLGHTCLECLRKHVRYGREALESEGGEEPPDVHVSGKVEHGILTLSCHAYGFYPSTIGISWMKGMKSGIVPNRDSTFHPWPGIEALPEEREQHRCWVEHPGMPEIGIFSWGGAGNVGCGNWEFGNEGQEEEEAGQRRRKRRHGGKKEEPEQAEEAPRAGSALWIRSRSGRE
uniref:Uncharacterized protein n=1 Tax=Corvus moneduloides TaxID=1196302 RepID=A0A8U7NR78_CORMO